MNSPSPARNVCALVPAAGRGTRLQAGVPKIFASILPEVTIWDAVRTPLSEVAARIVLVLSPEGLEYRNDHPAAFQAGSFDKTVIGLQTSALGMGDAIFGSVDLWRDYDDLLIVWGDQFNLSLETLRACIEIQAQQKRPALTLPLVRVPNAYVEYVFDSAGRLTQIRQSREGDICEPNGLSDVGMFLLSGTAALIEEWTRYREESALGSVTGEINFLPFLVHLSAVGWPVHRYETHDPAEAIGINTPEDLAFARQLLRQKIPLP